MSLSYIYEVVVYIIFQHSVVGHPVRYIIRTSITVFCTPLPLIPLPYNINNEFMICVTYAQ
jgi:hypothetical protein